MKKKPELAYIQQSKEFITSTWKSKEKLELQKVKDIPKKKTSKKVKIQKKKPTAFRKKSESGWTINEVNTS